MKATLSLLPFFFALSAVSATPASNQRRDDGWIQLNLNGTNYIPILPTFHPNPTGTSHPNPTGTFSHNPTNNGNNGIAYSQGMISDIQFQLMNFAQFNFAEAVAQAKTKCDNYNNGNDDSNGYDCKSFAIWSQAQREWAVIFFNYTITPGDFRPAPTSWSVENAAAYTK